MPKTVHIIGAGLAGLSAAVRLAGQGTRVIVHEATALAGGRCRSYFDQVTGMTIDNGNHLLLSANSAALAYAEAIGARDRLVGPATAQFPFMDVATGRRWTVDLGESRLPLWIFDPARRVPDTKVTDYLRFAPLLWAGADRTIGQQVDCSGTLYDRFLYPLLVSALNIAPPEGSAALAAAILKETVAAGGQACRPLIARDGLSGALVDPAMEFLRARGSEVRFERQLRKIEFDETRVVALDFGAGGIPLNDGEAVILAVPPWSAGPLVPGLQPPTEFRAILNAHFRIDPPPSLPPILGIVGGTTDWIFAFPGRIGVTVSAGDHLMTIPREQVAATIWSEVAVAAGLERSSSAELPPWQIVRERRATFAATPQVNAARPAPQTAWKNLALAGDWTQTDLPATIEGAIRSGNRAADLISRSA